MTTRTVAICGSYQQISRETARLLHSRRSPESLEDALRSRVEVLVPSSSVARALQRELLLLSPRGLIGIDFQTPETLAWKLTAAAGESRRVAEPRERRLALELALRQVDGDAPSGAAWLERTLRDTLDSGVTLQVVERNVARHPSPARLARALAIWRGTFDRLERGGLVDPSAILQRAIALLERGATVQPQIIFGFYDATGLQERLIGTLLDRGMVDVAAFPFDIAAGAAQPPLEFATRFYQNLGGDQRFDAQPVEREKGGGRTSLHLFANPEMEARGVAGAIAADLTAGVAPARIAVVRRSIGAAELRLLARHARDFQVPLALSNEVPLTSTRIGRAVVTLLRLRQLQFDRGSVIELAHAGVGAHVDPERIDVASRRLEIAGGPAEAVERQLAHGDPSARTRWKGIEEYLRQLESLVRLDASLPEAAPATAWADALLKVVAELRPQSGRELEAVLRVEGLSESLRRLGGEQELGRTNIIDMLKSESVQSPGGDGVWVGDVMQLRGRDFDVVYLIGCEDDVFPQRRNDDVLLPDQARPSFGVRVIGDGEAEERLLFALTTTAAERTHVSCSVADALGKVKRVSRFMTRLAVELNPDSEIDIARDLPAFVAKTHPKLASGTSTSEALAARLGSGGVADRRIAAQLRQLLYGGTRSEFDGVLAAGQELSEQLGRKLELVSPTRLERFGDCPHKFLVSSLLDARELDAPDHEIEIQSRKRGTLQHQILERFYRSLDENDYASVSDDAMAALPVGVKRKFDAVADAALAEFDERHPPAVRVVRRAEKEAVREKLLAWIVADLRELSGSGFRPHALEFRFGQLDDGQPADAPAASLTIGDLRVKVRGSIDRIDHHAATGRYRIIDYKDGKGLSYQNLDELVRQGRSLQLIFYARAWQEYRGVAPELIDAIIRPVGEPDLKPEKFSFNLAEVEGDVAETLELFATSIQSGRFPAVPSESACRYCVVKRSCRTAHDAEERLVLGARSPRDLLAGWEAG